MPNSLAISLNNCLLNISLIDLFLILTFFTSATFLPLSAFVAFIIDNSESFLILSLEIALSNLSDLDIGCFIFISSGARSSETTALASVTS